MTDVSANRVRSEAGTAEMPQEERLQKVLAHAGIASRRHAEQLIAQGRVKVNGQVITRPGVVVSPLRDVVEVDGHLVRERETFAYYMVNKPAGYVTTVRDPQRRPTVMSLLAAEVAPKAAPPARVYPVGRLDADSEGLLLLMNDGELAHRLTHPRFGVEKEYVVEIAGRLQEAEVDRIRRGVTSAGEFLKPDRVRIEDQTSGSTRLAVVLSEGKKREVRRMVESVKRTVIRLTRVRFGPLKLDDLPAGECRALNREEIERLRAATSA